MAQESDRAVFAFTAGEIAPKFAARSDVEKFSTSCRTLQNMTLGAFGYAERRAGLQFIAEAGPSIASPSPSGSPSPSPSPSPTFEYEAETLAWQAAVAVAGGTLNAGSLDLVNDLVLGLKATTAFAKIVYLLPLAGAELDAALTPLLDPNAFGRPTNTNFVDGDFSESTGLQGGATKVLTLPFNGSELGAGGNGGVGFVENNVPVIVGSPGPCGAYSNATTERYGLDLRATVERFDWGNAGNSAATAVGTTNSRYYGQRSSATSRALYRNGVSVATNSTSDAAAGFADRDHRLMGIDKASSVTIWLGRCALFFATNGTLDATEVANVDTAIAAFLTAAGR